MLDNNIKFNLFIGENFNELVSLPTNQLIIRNLLSVTDRDVIVLNNSLSLPELVQKLMDKILYSKKEIVEIISNIFSMENKSDLTFYNNIFDSNIFSSCSFSLLSCKSLNRRGLLLSSPVRHNFVGHHHFFSHHKISLLYLQ